MSQSDNVAGSISSIQSASHGPGGTLSIVSKAAPVAVIIAGRPQGRFEGSMVDVMAAR